MYTIANYNPYAAERKVKGRLMIDTALPIAVTSEDATVNVSDFIEISVGSTTGEAHLELTASHAQSARDKMVSRKTSGFTITTPPEFLPLDIMVEFYVYYQKSTFDYRLVRALNVTVTEPLQEIAFATAACKLDVTIKGAQGFKTVIRNGIKKVYEQDSLVKVSTSALLQPGCNTLPSGTLRATLSNANNIFDADNASSFINNINRYSTVTFQVKCFGEGLETDWENLWWGYYDTRNISRDGTTIDLTASDCRNDRTIIGVKVTAGSGGEGSAPVVSTSGTGFVACTGVRMESDRSDFLFEHSLMVTGNRRALKNLALALECEIYPDRNGVITIKDITDSELCEEFGLEKTMLEFPALKLERAIGSVYIEMESGTSSSVKKSEARNFDEATEFEDYESISRTVTIIPASASENAKLNNVRTAALWLAKREALKKTYYFNDRGNICRELGDKVSVPIRRDKSAYTQGYLTRIDYSYDGTFSSYIEVSCALSEEIYVDNIITY